MENITYLGLSAIVLIFSLISILTYLVFKIKGVDIGLSPLLVSAAGILLAIILLHCGLCIERDSGDFIRSLEVNIKKIKIGMTQEEVEKTLFDCNASYPKSDRQRFIYEPNGSKEISSFSCLYKMSVTYNKEGKLEGLYVNK